MKTFREAMTVGAVCGVLFFLGAMALLWAFSLQEDDIFTEQNLYCAMVFEGTWPDYEKTFEKSCAGWLTEHDKPVN